MIGRRIFSAWAIGVRRVLSKRLLETREIHVIDVEKIPEENLQEGDGDLVVV